MDIRNTRSMCMTPESPDEFAMLDQVGDGAFQLLAVMTGGKFGETVAYPVIVEAWGKKDCGRGRRAWLAAFTAGERDTIGRYYARFYRWHLVSGTPKHVSCRLKTIELLQRAVAFFAGL